MNARRTLGRLRAQALAWSGVNAWARARLDGSRAAILMYHRILPRAEAERLAVEPGMFVTPETFARHLDWLTENFHVLPLGEIVTRLGEQRALPRGACALSFDDGWRDNHDHAFPALARRGVPATVFLVTSRVGTLAAFWPDEVCRRMAGLAPRARVEVAASLGAKGRGNPTRRILARLKRSHPAQREELLERLRQASAAALVEERELLDWSEVERMAKGGIEFESHGASHAILTHEPSQQLEAELCKARSALVGRGLGRQALLAYPNGSYDARVSALARRAGYRAAVTTRPALLTASLSCMEVPRIGMHQDGSATRAELFATIARSARA